MSARKADGCGLEGDKEPLVGEETKASGGRGKGEWRNVCLLFILKLKNINRLPIALSSQGAWSRGMAT